MSERAFTETEWRRREALRSCAMTGHDWSITSMGDGTPIRLSCGSCGWSGGVEMGERPSLLASASGRA